MQHRYAHILQPVQVGNLILKNRLISSKCIPEGIQGPAKWPTEQTINFAASLAKNWNSYPKQVPFVLQR